MNDCGELTPTHLMGALCRTRTEPQDTKRRAPGSALLIFKFVKCRSYPQFPRTPDEKGRRLVLGMTESSLRQLSPQIVGKSMSWHKEAPLAGLSAQGCLPVISPRKRCILGWLGSNVQSPMAGVGFVANTPIKFMQITQFIHSAFFHMLAATP